MAGEEDAVPVGGRPETQPEVHRLLGRCLILVQCYEQGAKAILAARDVRSDDADLSSAAAARQARMAVQTLGALAGQLTDGFLVPWDQPDTADPATGARFAMNPRIAFPPDAFAEVVTELREVVALRNRLVHHFLQDHDLASEPGCQRAVVALQDAHARLSAAYDRLTDWAMDMDRARSAMAAELALPVWQDFIGTGRIPLAHSAIARALHAAAMALGAGDWTAVDAAVAWVRAGFPQETPDGYGCVSWPQVIHDSGLFDLQRRGDGPRRFLCYRPRAARLPPS